MANPFVAVGHYLENLGKALFGQLKVTVVKFLHDFGRDELGKLAIQAVQFAAQSVGLSDADKLALAKSKLTDLVKDAGTSAETLGESSLNFLIESGVQAVKAEANKGIVALGGAVTQ